MSQLNFRQLIDLAIGSPEPGHVNFYALHVLLYSFADKLNIIDDPVDCGNYEQASLLSNPIVKQQLSDTSLQRKLDSEKLERYGASSNYTIKLSTRNSARGPSNEVRIAGGAEPNEEDAPKEADAEAAATATAPAPAPETEAEATDTAPAAEEPAAPVEEPPPAAPEAPTPAPLKGDVLPVDSFHKDIEDGVVELKSSLQEIDNRISHLEVNFLSDTRGNGDVIKGISIMKDQLQLAMEELRIIINVMTGSKLSSRRMDRLLNLSKRLVAIQRENVYIGNIFVTNISESDPSLEEEVGEEHEPSDLIEIQSQPSYTGVPPVRDPKEDQYELDLHLCYSPEKILDQLMELKTEFCVLTNKINDITATILEQDCQRTTLILSELQDQMHDMKFLVSSLKEKIDGLEIKEQNSIENILYITSRVDVLAEEKIDKTEVEILLADKADYSQLQRKVSIEFVQEMQCRLDKQFCEIRKLMNLNEKNTIQMMENMRTSLGLASVDEVLRKFKEKIDHDIHLLRDTLKKYIEATDDECAAAGARIKVLQDLACLSCDTTCVMRTVEKAKVGRLPSAHATSLLSPLITYELGSIRKSGIMGYYRKDEFPHAPSAWMNRQNVNIKACVPRHAGGSHTTHTAKEHVDKVLQSKK